MNAPLPEHIRKALETVTLDDKYSLDYGRAFLNWCGTVLPIRIDGWVCGNNHGVRRG